MKRLLIIWCLALPVLFAGCSQEEDLLPEQREKLEKNRALLAQLEESEKRLRR